MNERIAYQFNGDHVLKFAGMEKLTGEQVTDELNRLYTIIAEQNEKIAALEREVEALRENGFSVTLHYYEGQFVDIGLRISWEEAQ